MTSILGLAAYGHSSGAVGSLLSWLAHVFLASVVWRYVRHAPPAVLLVVGLVAVVIILRRHRRGARSGRRG